MEIKNYCVYKIEIKNVNKLKRELKNSLKKYNKKIYSSFLYEIIDKATGNDIEGLNDYEISSCFTKSKNLELIYYNVEGILKNDILIKVVIEF